MFQAELEIQSRSAEDEKELLHMAQRGSLEAFTMLYHRYLPGVYNRVRCLVPQADVEDVTQEVFIALLKSLKLFKGDAKLSTWLRTITNRRIADYYRGHGMSIGRRDSNMEEAETRPELQTPSQSSAIDDQVAVRQAMLALPDDYREVILMRFVENLTFREIACLRGQSLEAVKSLFRRAIEALRHQMSKSNV